MWNFYWNNSWALKGGTGKFILQIFIYPVLCLLIGYSVLKIFENFNISIQTNFVKNYGEILTYISGFLFAGLSILLSNTTFNQDQEKYLWGEYKFFICRFGGIENQETQNPQKISSGIKKWITKLKFSLLLDVLVLVILSIICLLCSIFENVWILVFVKYLFLVCIIQLFSLLWRIISYLKIIEFNIK